MNSTVSLWIKKKLISKCYELMLKRNDISTLYQFGFSALYVSACTIVQFNAEKYIIGAICPQFKSRRYLHGASLMLLNTVQCKHYWNLRIIWIFFTDEIWYYWFNIHLMDYIEQPLIMI